tara:strand:- start:352987 stop:353259 length:273 start_codon:yes stop_codon:yes gene_type:complete
MLTSPDLGKQMIHKFLLAGFACFMLSFAGCEKTADSVDDAGAAMGEMADDAAEAAQDAGSAIEEGAKDMADGAADAVGSAADAVKEKVSE